MTLCTQTADQEGNKHFLFSEAPDKPICGAGLCSVRGVSQDFLGGSWGGGVWGVREEEVWEFGQGWECVQSVYVDLAR